MPTWTPASLCLLTTSALGDVTHVVPLVRTLKAGFPHAKLTWIVGKLEHKLVGDIAALDALPDAPFRAGRRHPRGAAGTHTVGLLSTCEADLDRRQTRTQAGRRHLRSRICCARQGCGTRRLPHLTQGTGRAALR